METKKTKRKSETASSQPSKISKTEEKVEKSKSSELKEEAKKEKKLVTGKIPIQNLIEEWEKGEDEDEDFSLRFQEEGKKHYDKLPEKVKKSWPNGTWVCVGYDGTVITAKSHKVLSDEICARKKFGYVTHVGPLPKVRIRPVNATPDPNDNTSCTSITGTVSHNAYRIYNQPNNHTQQVEFTIDDGAEQTVIDRQYLNQRYVSQGSTQAEAAFGHLTICGPENRLHSSG